METAKFRFMYSNYGNSKIQVYVFLWKQQNSGLCIPMETAKFRFMYSYENSKIQVYVFLWKKIAQKYLIYNLQR